MRGKVRGERKEEEYIGGGREGKDEGEHSRASLSLMCYNTELPLRVGLVYNSLCHITPLLSTGNQASHQLEIY